MLGQGLGINVGGTGTNGKLKRDSGIRCQTYIPTEFVTAIKLLLIQPEVSKSSIMIVSIYIIYVLGYKYNRTHRIRFR